MNNGKPYVSLREDIESFGMLFLIIDVEAVLVKSNY